jgi:hypothetical protein
MENSSLVQTDLIEDKVQMIMRQSDYSEEVAREKLAEFKFDEIAVIRDYFGLSEKKTSNVKSINQEIYKQLRSHLDDAMRNYRDRVDKGEVKKVV